MQTLLLERSGALSITPPSRGSIEDVLSIAHVPLPAIDLDEHEPLRELWPCAPLAESTDSTLRAATGITEEGMTSAPDGPEPTYLTESEFVLALPMSLSAREAVARAREQGLIISEPFVYKIRYDAMAAPEPAIAAVPVTAQAEQRLEVGAAQGQASAPEAPKAALPSKAAFIRGLPMDLRPKEVVVRGEEQGLTFTTVYVRDVRAAAKARALGAIPAATVTPSAPSAPLAPAMAAGPEPAPTNAAPSKADFVRSLPPEVSFAEASARAKDAGIGLSSAHFYALKSQVKKRAAAPAPKSKPVREPKGPASRAPVFGGLQLASDDPCEQALIEAVRALGVARACALIAAIEKFERVTTR